ncbi:transposase [Fusobacterium russii]|uniref:transposase n=1 Tax=Fusobacterium russii TaxID=854 RepID=UPI0003A75DEA|nr:transposase [Fusobacterium russii]
MKPEIKKDIYEEIYDLLHKAREGVYFLVLMDYCSNPLNTFFCKQKNEKLCFDEFKSTKDADGAMSFIYCDAETSKVIDIIEDRKLNNLIKYFSRSTKNARNQEDIVKFLLSSNSNFEDSYDLYQDILINISDRRFERFKK